MSSYFEKDTPDIVLKSLFFKYDTDDSGLLSTEEIKKLLEHDLGLNYDEAEAYTLLLDKDSSGKLSFDEFKAWLNSGENLDSIKDNSRFNLMKNAVNYFKNYDTDMSGGLSQEEFTRLHVDLGGKAEYAESALHALDKDSNGKISFFEFLKWLNWIEMKDF